MLKHIFNTAPFHKTKSPIEEILYDKLLDYGLNPISRYNVGPFFLDIAFPEIKLAIEADGRAYHSSKEQVERDSYRQKRLMKLGWTFERFSGRFIYRNGDAAVAKIALRYFEQSLTEEKRLFAKGSLVRFFTRIDTDYALELTNLFLREATGTGHGRVVIETGDLKKVTAKADPSIAPPLKTQF